jgi:hypothetical protein
MAVINEISKKDCITIGKKIRENIFQPALNFKTTIFLCGADKSNNTTIRYKIAKILSSRIAYETYYDIIYPEDIFEEMLYSSSSLDLLSLENLLADSVDAIIIIPESPGSFAELGAFSSNEKLKNKLICVLDIKFQRDKSFINQGPVKLVKGANKDNIVFINPDLIGKKEPSLSYFYNDPEIDKILAPLKKLKRNRPKVQDKFTLLQLDKFLLPTIFLLEPISRSVLIDIISNEVENKKHSSSLTITALSILTKKRYIELSSDGYKLTELGINEFLSFRKKNSRYKQQDKIVAIDDLRLEILNLRNRKKKLKV